MTLVNFIPEGKIEHKINTIDCLCEPKILDMGKDHNGQHIVVIKHSNPEGLILVNEEGLEIRA